MSFELSVKNLSGESAIIQQIWVCDSENWSIQRISDTHEINRTTYYPYFPKQMSSQQLIERVEDEYYVVLAMLFNYGTDKWNLKCPAVDTKRLRLEPIEGGLAVPSNGGVSRIRAFSYPDRWRIMRLEGDSAKFNDQCPIQLKTDIGNLLHAPACVHLMSAGMRALDEP